MSVCTEHRAPRTVNSTSIGYMARITFPTQLPVCVFRVCLFILNKNMFALMLAALPVRRKYILVAAGSFCCCRRTRMLTFPIASTGVFNRTSEIFAHTKLGLFASQSAGHAVAEADHSFANWLLANWKIGKWAYRQWAPMADRSMVRALHSALSVWLPLPRCVSVCVQRPSWRGEKNHYTVHAGKH